MNQPTTAENGRDAEKCGLGFHLPDGWSLRGVAPDKGEVMDDSFYRSFGVVVD